MKNIPCLIPLLLFASCVQQTVVAPPTIPAPAPQVAVPSPAPQVKVAAPVVKPQTKRVAKPQSTPKPAAPAPMKALPRTHSTLLSEGDKVKSHRSLGGEETYDR